MPTNPPAATPRWVKPAVWLYWTVYLTAQLSIAFRLTIDHYDAFQYLCNARRLAGAPVPYNVVFRTPLIPLLHAPAQKLMDWAQVGVRARLWAPHFIHALISTTCMAAFYLYLRKRRIPSAWAHMGAVLLSLNRMTIHYFSSALPDIPCALFLLLFLIFLDAEKPKAGSAAAAAALGACLLGRWNMMIVPPLAACGVLWRGERSASLWRFLTVAAGGVCAALLAYLAIYRGIYGLPPISGLHFLANNFQSASIVNQAVEPLGAYVDSLRASAGAAAAAAFAIGFLACLINSPRSCAMEYALFLGFFGVMTLVVGHKESRYLLPVVPFYYFFMIHGLQALARQTKRLLSSSILVPRTILACFLGACAVSAAKEWRRFRDPAYRDPIFLDMMRTIQAHRKPGEAVYWNGRAHSIAPQNWVFTRSDAFYYLYHVPNQESLEYLLGEDVRAPEDKSAMRPGDILVRAPFKIEMLDEPINREDNKITIYQMTDPRAPLETLAVLY